MSKYNNVSISFEVGELVKVKNVQRRTEVQSVSFTTGMRLFIGKTFAIKRKSTIPEFYVLDNPNSNEFFYHISWLEKV